jgi:hypothetical protein
LKCRERAERGGGANGAAAVCACVCVCTVRELK